MPTSPDDVLRELQEISARIESAVGPERAELELRRDDLRREARLIYLGLNDPAALAAELQHLRRRLEQMDAERLQLPKWQELIGARITDPAAAGRDINRRLDAATADERSAIEARIADIELRLGEE